MKPVPPPATTPAPASTDTPAKGPPITKVSPLKRAWDWLMEDPSKKKRKGPTEREKAIAAAEAADRERRKAVLAKTLHLPLAAAKPTQDGTPAAQPAPAAGTQPDAKKTARPPGPIKRALHAVLGERAHKSPQGETVVIPPAKTDWRWNLHVFFRSQRRVFSYLRTTLLLVIVLSTVWTSVYATTGFDLTQSLDQEDPEDVRTKVRFPFFIVESGSMMHDKAPYGRVGTVDPGDVVVIEKVKDRKDIQTFYGEGDRKSAGGHGDVIVFFPTEQKGVTPFPIVHRAMAWIQRDSVEIPNPRAAEPAQPVTVRTARFTVEEFGIFDARSVNIPELGLYNYQPDLSGFITRGDNTETNTWADQSLGVTPDPVPFERVVGRLKFEIPVLGLAKIALMGQNAQMLSVDEEWCGFLAGKAACDTWQVFFVVVVLVVGVPFVLTLTIFGRRLYVRALDRIAQRRLESDDAARMAALKAEGGAAIGAPPALVIHDAVDLLSGRVRVHTEVPAGGKASWDDLTQPARVSFVDEDGV